MNPIHVLIADDHTIIRNALRNILADTSDLVVAGEAANGHEVVEKVRQQDWGLLMLDLSMPGRSGIELIKLIKSERPRLPVLVYSMHPEEQYGVRAMRAGASGYLSKECDPDLILPAMRKVAHGGMYFSGRVAEMLMSDVSTHGAAPKHNSLTDREHEVFKRLIQGDSLTEIARELSLSIKTISTHKSHIFAKLDITSNIQLVRYAIEHQLIDPSLH